MALAAASAGTTYYSTRDDIKNFKIRVTLRELTSAELISASPRTAEGVQALARSGGGGGISANLLDRRKGGGEQQRPKEEKITLRWQQKVEKRTHHREQLQQQRLFTYTDSDGYGDETPASTSRAAEGAALDRLRAVRKAAEADALEDGDQASAAALSGNYQRYFIMADLAATEDGSDGGIVSSVPCLVELCHLYYDTRGQLAVTPDFKTKEDSPYRIEGAGGVFFEYTLENVSRTRPSDPSEEPPPSHRPGELWEWEDDLEGEADDSNPANVRLTVVLELTRLLHSPVGASVYLSCALHLPPGWREVGSSGAQSGSTHVCLVLSDEDGDTHAIYSKALTVCLAASDPGRAGLTWPALLMAAFEECSGDSERDLGYATLDLAPRDSSGEPQVTALWLPVPLSATDALRRHFLPGCRLLPHAGYLAPQCVQRDKPGQVSRFGLVTETTCAVEWKLQTLLQTRQGLPDLAGTLIGLPGPRVSTKKVLAAFRKSTRKLRLVTAGLQVG